MIGKLKYFIRNATPKNAWFIIQSWLRKWLVPIEVQRMMVMHKAKQCPDCYEARQCVVCGCDSMPMFRSDKPCPYYGSWFVKDEDIVDTETKRNGSI